MAKEDQILEILGLLKQQLDDFVLETREHFKRLDDFVLETREHFKRLDDFVLETREHFERIDQFMEETREHFERIDQFMEETREYFKKLDDFVLETREHFERIDQFMVETNEHFERIDHELIKIENDLHQKLPILFEDHGYHQHHLEKNDKEIEELQTLSEDHSLRLIVLEHDSKVQAEQLAKLLPTN